MNDDKRLDIKSNKLENTGKRLGLSPEVHKIYYMGIDGKMHVEYARSPKD